MTDQDVPEVMQGRVLEYYQYLWARSKGQQMQELFADAPYCLQSELFLTITYDMLNNVRTCARHSVICMLIHSHLVYNACLILLIITDS